MKILEIRLLLREFPKFCDILILMFFDFFALTVEFYFSFPEEQIANCRQDIKDSKEELRQAKVIRKNKQGCYDVEYN